MPLTRVILALVMTLALLAACGKRGPLYYPDKKSPEQQEQTTPAQPESEPEQTPPPTAPGN